MPSLYTSPFSILPESPSAHFINISEKKWGGECSDSIQAYGTEDLFDFNYLEHKSEYKILSKQGEKISYDDIVVNVFGCSENTQSKTHKSWLQETDLN